MAFLRPTAHKVWANPSVGTIRTPKLARHSTAHGRLPAPGSQQIDFCDPPPGPKPHLWAGGCGLYQTPPGEGERDLFRRIAMSQGDQLGRQWKIIQTFVSSGYLKHSAPPKADISAMKPSLFMTIKQVISTCYLTLLPCCHKSSIPGPLYDSNHSTHYDKRTLRLVVDPPVDSHHVTEDFLYDT